MICQILFSRKNKKNIFNLSSAESAHSVVSVKLRIKNSDCLEILVTLERLFALTVCT